MDDRLARYYRNALSKGVWVITFLGVYLALTAERLAGILGDDSMWVDLLRSGLSMSVIAASFLFLERRVRTKLWKLAHPELDVSGIWEGETTYQIQQVAGDGESAEGYEPETTPHEIQFVQDCLTLRVGPTVAHDYPGSWFSLVAGFGENQVRYAYRVNYGKSPRRPSSATGYEELQLTALEKGQRPTELTGIFSHCAWGQKPVYSGTVRFNRRLDPEDSRSLLHRLSKSCAKLIAHWLKPRVA
jgi:hypothetical protein